MPNSVFTFTLMLTVWLMWWFAASECAPVLSKPINATRKIPQQPSVLPAVTAAAAVTTTTTAATITRSPLSFQLESIVPSQPIFPNEAPSSTMNSSVKPESMNSPTNASAASLRTNESPRLKQNASSTDNKRDDVNIMMGFLQRFGYLESQGSNSEALFSEDAITNAIRTMQTYGGIYPTGKMDNDTLKLLETPRCGNKDVDLDNDQQAHSRRRKRFVIGAPGWNKRRITYFLANWSPKIGDEEVTIQQLEKAFKIWSDYAHLKFVRVPTPDADIVILFGRGYHGDRYPFDGPGYTLAHAYFPYESDHFGGDVHFDEDEPWSINPPEGSSGIDFFTVATHELGHSLGLGHSPVPGSIMFPYYKGTQENLHLDYDDILAMYQLYISRQVHDDRNEDERSTTTTPNPATSTENSSGSITTTTTTRKPTRPTPRTTTPYDHYDDVDDYGVGDDYRDDYNDVGDESGSSSNGKSEAGNDGEGGVTGTRETMTTSVMTTTSTTTTTTTSTTTTTTTEKPITINYDGDYESVDDHRRKFNVTVEAPPSSIPDICHGHFDAVSVLRNELFFFKDQYVWRLRQRAVIDHGYPTHIRHLFRELPWSLPKVDAVYERPNGHIVFFSGPRYWVFDGDRMVEQNSPLDQLGLPEGLDQLDAAIVWGKNKKTYFFRRNLYWRYDDVKRRMDPGYPHDLSRWKGVPSDLDAAMQWTDGQTYFFKRNLYWRFDDTLIRADSRYPMKATSYWLGCPE